MSLAPLSSVASTPAATEVTKPAPAPSTPQASATLKPDTVSVSAAGHAASTAVDADGDHDGR
jgi:hypothetical protein